MKVGKRYEVIQSGRKGYKNKLIGTVVQEYPSFYVLETRNYKTCVDKAGMISSQYNITAI
ncbi:hypothetical protein [Senegalia massiliensis]|uniref:KOW domain-containing protein n=1 Tax=Senegalia massiliensis TaxID=1720316 RepID=A0A845QYP4_9CLOT|nr:hypothetical protein [Senegalia massiliensis]NBI08087.1 hypothetical protein [Senegalia massiliensis]